MTTHEFDGYKVNLSATNRTDHYGHILVSYSLVSPAGEVLFENDDLGASPLHDPESKETAIALLSFLTLQPGDTDPEYFDKYTPRQKEWSESPECEYLSIFSLDE